MKYKTFFTIIFLLIISCSKFIEKDDNLEILISKFSSEPFSFFDINFFKNNIDKNAYIDVLYPNSIHLYGYSGITLEKKYNKEEFDSIASELNIKSIFRTSIQDKKKYLMLNNKVKVDNKFPIPNLEDETNKKIDCSQCISSNSSYVLGFQKEYGVFFTDDFLTKSKKNRELDEFLKKRKNGFSSGAIIDSNSYRIIYWVIIW